MTIHTRRGFFKSVSATAATAALPATALAYQGPVTETPEPRLPNWWERLTGSGAEADEGVFHPWSDTPETRELACKLEDLREFLLSMGHPEGVDLVTDFRLHWDGDGSPHNVIVTGRSGFYGEGLHLFRPEFGWIDRTPQIVGGSV